MTPFTYSKAQDAADAIRRGGATDTKYLGGGTNLVDLMRETIERPRALVDITGLPDLIEERVMLPPHDPEHEEGQEVGVVGAVLRHQEMPEPGNSLGLGDSWPWLEDRLLRIAPGGAADYRENARSCPLAATFSRPD